MFPGEWDYILIPDCRFPNEIFNIKGVWGNTVHLRVFRTGFITPLTEEQQMHPSETALDGVIADYVVNNFGTLEDLDRSVLGLLEATRNFADT